MSNAVRHASASELSVAVSVDDDFVIEVVDNGVGIPQVVARSGLRNLAERALAHGGRFEAVSAETGGTRLLWSVRLPQ